MKSLSFGIGAAWGAISMMPFVIRIFAGCVLSLVGTVLMRYPTASYAGIIALPPIAVSLPFGLIGLEAFATAWMAAMAVWIWLIAFSSLRARR